MERNNGRYTLNEIIIYQKSFPWWQYLARGSIIFIIVGAIMTLFEPIDSFL